MDIKVFFCVYSYLHLYLYLCIYLLISHLWYFFFLVSLFGFMKYRFLEISCHTGPVMFWHKMCLSLKIPDCEESYKPHLEASSVILSQTACMWCVKRELRESHEMSEVSLHFSCASWSCISLKLLVKFLIVRSLICGNLIPLTIRSFMLAPRTCKYLDVHL